jgi:nucleotidyltransferase substrate binding protein (TIGR01987 family)
MHKQGVGVESKKIDLSYIIKAQKVFDRFRLNLADDQAQAGAVQAFEFCYELAWKMMKRILAARGVETGSPADTFRKAVHEGLIDDPEVWFGFQKKRNLTSHTYEQEVLDAIVAIFDEFSRELAVLISRLEKMV